MQMTLKSQPVFTWQQNNKGHSLFCGTVFIAAIRWEGHEHGYEYYRIERAAFTEELAEAGDDLWHVRPFNLKGKAFAEIADIVEQLYTAVLDKLHFVPILA